MCLRSSCCVNLMKQKVIQRRCLRNWWVSLMEEDVAEAAGILVWLKNNQGSGNVTTKPQCFLEFDWNKWRASEIERKIQEREGSWLKQKWFFCTKLCILITVCLSIKNCFAQCYLLPPQGSKPPTKATFLQRQILNIQSLFGQFNLFLQFYMGFFDNNRFRRAFSFHIKATNWQMTQQAENKIPDGTLVL